MHTIKSFKSQCEDLAAYTVENVDCNRLKQPLTPLPFERWRAFLPKNKIFHKLYLQLYPESLEVCSFTNILVLDLN